MKYALGNILNGAGGLNADGLALDLQFATDKTLTARKGPTPTFTRASTGRFVGSDGLIQSAAVNAPRFDHDPVTLACKGLLIEESRTNTLIRSSELSNATSWVQTNVTTSSSAAPDGTNTATLFNEGTATGEHAFYGAFAQNRPVMGAVSCTLSLFLKAGTRRYVILNASDFVNGAGMIIDTQDWIITDAKAIGTGWTYTSSRLTNYGNGQYRAELTFTPPAAAAVIPRLGGSASSTFSALAQSYIGTNSTFIAWGAQLETGSFATSYIPTTTASVIRSADVCSISGSAFTSFYNPLEGTTFISAIRNTNTGNPRSYAITNGLTGNRSEQVRGPSAEEIGYYAGGSFLHSLILNSATVGVNYRVAHAMAINNFAASMNGGSPVINNSGIMLTADRMIIGAIFTGGSSFHNGTISSIRYYKKRLSNTKLQSLTA